MSIDQATRVARPLPGVSFETPALGGPLVLPRLDITGFVGYAASGPLDIPVLVQDVQCFEEVFGQDLVLADGYAARTGPGPAGETRQATGLLGPTVRAFFRNGGRTCWVVRVGQGAETSRFVVPGLVGRTAAGMADAPDMCPVVVEGRSPGSFLDEASVVARVSRRAIPVISGSLLLTGSGGGSLAVPASVSAYPGDLLELVSEDGHTRRTLWVPLRSRAVDGTGRVVLSWRENEETWLRPAHDSESIDPRGAQLRTAAGDKPITVNALHIDSLDIDSDGRAALVADLPVEVVPSVGDLLIIETKAGDKVVATVGTPPEPVAGTQPTAGHPSTRRWSLHGWPAWCLLDSARGRQTPGTFVRAAVLELDLAVRNGDAIAAAVNGLGLCRDHPRWLGQLPSDREMYRRRYREVATGSPDAGRPASALEAETESPRFALAAPESMPEFCLPLGLGPAYGASGFGSALSGEQNAYARNGVSEFTAEAFVDPWLAAREPAALMAEARRRFLVEDRDLRGVHALLPLEDVAVVSVPDALHGSWEQIKPPAPHVVDAPALTYDPATDRLSWDDPFGMAGGGWVADQYILERSPQPDLSVQVEATVLPGSSRETPASRRRCGAGFYRVRARRRGTSSPWSVTIRVAALRDGFDDCTAVDLVAPDASLDDLNLVWTAPAGPFEVVQSSHPLFEDIAASRVPTKVGVDGTQTGSAVAGSVPLDRPPMGARYARVRTVAAGMSGPWSVTVALPADPTERRVVIEPDPSGGTGPSQIALDVHRALAAVTAARQDLTALASFPRWYGAELVERHLGELSGDVSRLHAHHPWGLVADVRADGVVGIPVDGAVAGRLADGSLVRGPWVAVAGSPLAGMLGVASQPVAVDPLRLRGSQVNGVLSTRRGVMLTGVDTLSSDRQVRPVSVRRLLILVRRLALREGNELVFEPNGPDLRRLIQTRFEGALGLIYRLGGLAGASAGDAYRVLCDEGLNPPWLMDVGRVVVELQLAPSYPLEYLVVRLVQRVDGGFELAEVTR